MKPIENLLRLLAPMRRRIQLMVSRGTVTRVDDGTKTQRVQLTALAGETLENVEHLQPFGLSSVPFPGAEGIVVCVGGSRDHPLALVVDDKRTRPTGEDSGTVRIYSVQKDVHGVPYVTAYIKLWPNGRISLHSAGEIDATGNFVGTGNITALGDVRDNQLDPGSRTMAQMRALYNSHTHPGGGPPSPQM